MTKKGETKAAAKVPSNAEEALLLRQERAAKKRGPNVVLFGTAENGGLTGVIADESQGIRTEGDMREWMSTNNFLGSAKAYAPKKWGKNKNGVLNRHVQEVLKIS